MKTTLYGNGAETNEFGHPKVAKETNFVHAVYSVKDPIPRASMADLVVAYMEANDGRKPSKLFLAGPSNGTRFIGFKPYGPDRGPYVFLDIVYDAPENRVE